MTIMTTYTCDKCGHAQEKPDQMWEVGITVRENTYHYAHSETPREQALWCRSCVVKLGLLPPSKAANDPPTPTPPPTFEDMIREIIQDEISGLES